MMHGAIQCNAKLFGISLTFCFHTDVVKIFDNIENILNIQIQTRRILRYEIMYRISVNNVNTYMIYQIYLLNNMTG